MGRVIFWIVLDQIRNQSSDLGAFLKHRIDELAKGIFRSHSQKKKKKKHTDDFAKYLTALFDRENIVVTQDSIVK